MDLSDNPFQPGAGRFPPLRAGHDEAATYLATGLKKILGKKGGDTVVLYGPRGNGKTVLLHELRRAAGKKVRRHSLTTRMMAGDPDVIAEEFAPNKGAFFEKVEGANIGAGGAELGVKLRRRTQVTPWHALRATLAEGPVLLTIDEAHEMPVDFGQELLQATQGCVADGLPLLVVLAGTPGLPAHLKEMHASFWERCEKLPIGRLETAKMVEDALAKPARKSGMPINGGALEKLVEESQRYPFFVQKLGFESWNAAHRRGGSRRITLEDAQRGIAIAGKKLQVFYSDRRREAGEQDVLGEAEAVSRMVIAKGRDDPLTTSELMDAVESVATPAGRDPGESWEKLVHLGLVWESSEPDLWEPGIPSLCRYVVDKVGVPVPRKRPA